MLKGFTITLLAILGTMASVAQPGRRAIVGTWQLVSRIDRDLNGNVQQEPSLGADPIGYLVYDSSGHVFVQMMAQHRTAKPLDITSPADKNNLAHVGSYDAYFGHYEIDTVGGIVTHQLEGALSQADIGRSLTRRFHLEGDTLTIRFEPGGQGTTRTRTLIWHRVSH